MLDEERMIRYDGIEFVQGWPTFLFKATILNAISKNPFPLRSFSGLLAKPLQELRDIFVRRRLGVHPTQPDPIQHEMGMGFNKPGQHGLTL
jgi:hypothetical protein